MAFGLLKSCGLRAYYVATWRARRRAAVERTATATQPVCVLFYHRVADEYPNDWTMPTGTFARQIAWLRKRFDLVSLPDAQSRIASGRNPIPTACITFDDGYADNLKFAVPHLVNHEIPVTYFVSTNQVLGGQPFPHDVEAGQTLPPNTSAEIRELAAAGVEIGSHTRSHANLGRNVDEARLIDEIAGSKRALEQVIGRAVRYFAFPYGLQSNLSTDAFRVAYEAGYEGVCSAYGGYNFPGDDAFHLRRIHADPQMIRLINWLTIDPRKLKMQRDFEPGDFRGFVSSCVSRGGDGEKGRGGEIAPAAISPPLPLSPSPTLR